LIHSIVYSVGLHESILKKYFGLGKLDKLDPEAGHYSEENKTAAINKYVRDLMDGYDYQARVKEMYNVTTLLNVNVAPLSIAPKVPRKSIKQGLNPRDSRKKRETEIVEYRKIERSKKISNSRAQRMTLDEGVRGSASD